MVYVDGNKERLYTKLKSNMIMKQGRQLIHNGCNVLYLHNIPLSCEALNLFSMGIAMTCYVLML